MKRFVVFMAIIVLILSSCSDSSSPEVTVGKIKIRVLNAKDSSPLSGALIKTTPPSQSVITDINGEAVIGDLESGNYNVNVEKVDFISNSTTVNVLANKTVQADILLYDHSFNNTLPEKPVLKTPAKNSIVNKTFTTLSWTCSDVDKDEISYTIYFDNVNPPVKILNKIITEQSYEIEDLNHKAEYFWSVEAKDKYGIGPKSSVFSFKVDTSSNVIIQENMVLNMPFDGSFQDFSNSNLITLCSNPAYSLGRNGDANSAFAFLSQNSVIVRNNSKIGFTNNFSVSFWIKPNSGYGFDMLSDLAQIIGRLGGTGENTSSWGIDFNSLGNIVFETYNVDNGTNREYSNNNVQVGEWSHICMVYSNSTVSFYINGQLDKYISMPPPQASNYDMYIGGRSTNNRYLNGYLDDLKVFNIALTSDEINDLYNE